MQRTSVPNRMNVFTVEDFPVEAFHDGVVLIGLDMQVLAANQAMAEIVPGDWMQECPLPVEQVVPAIYDEYEWVLQVVREQDFFRSKVLNVSRQGKMRSLLVDSHPLHDRSGERVGVVLILKDIGNIVSLEQQIQHNANLATVGKIAAGVAHEIRNPLTSIKGFLQIMRGELDKRGMKREHSFTDVMMREVDRVNGLVSELLLLSKPREMKREPIELEELVMSMAPIISSEALLHDIEFHLRLEAVPPVFADRELVKQVMLNLVKNAMEAMAESDGAIGAPAGGKLLITSGFDAEEKLVRIEVKDTGPGIPQFMMDRIFDAFFTTKETGTGLGLPICQRLINDMGGQIKVMSKGFGTTFSVLLPAMEG